MLPLLLLISCGGDTPSSLLDDVAATESWAFDGLTCPAHVVRTEMGVPHIYAQNQVDLARIQGFVVARDRYFMMEIARRLGLGTVSALLGDSALETDMECGKCESNLYLRRGARGPWLGCSRYPKCRGRGPWKGLDDNIREKWEKDLKTHEAENPAPVIKTVDGEICAPGYKPETLPENLQKEP